MYLHLSLWRCSQTPRKTFHSTSLANVIYNIHIHTATEHPSPTNSASVLYFTFTRPSALTCSTISGLYRTGIRYSFSYRVNEVIPQAERL